MVAMSTHLINARHQVSEDEELCDPEQASPLSVSWCYSFFTDVIRMNYLEIANEPAY